MSAKLLCKQDLYNQGKCFSKGKIYETNRYIDSQPQLMNVTLANDLGQPHQIGGWYKHFKILKNNH